MLQLSRQASHVLDIHLKTSLSSPTRPSGHNAPNCARSSHLFPNHHHPLPTAAHPHATFVAKVTRKETTRRLVLDEPCSFPTLCGLCVARFQLKPNEVSRASPRYPDPDGDLISVNTDVGCMLSSAF
mmetsp:Transcript_16130/g.39276  ORF Transcript_16130/g.39276 Transcript_16130/m.39276 type:complete len:127 (+) Transcript_16130:1-381(+)